MRKGTPTSALEVILDVPPIDLFVKAEATKAGYRLIGTSDDPAAKDGHIEKGLSELETLHIPIEQGNYIGKERIWEQDYEINDMGDGSDISHGIRCYTDGSKIGRDTGSGVCIMVDDKVVKTRAIGLSKHATVFQAELQAIQLGCSLVKEKARKGEKITFMVDSQAAILALNKIG